ncbi:hypothetical protein J7K50_06095 [bacterium]|nr:hypothetical protein [bacterium]
MDAYLQYLASETQRLEEYIQMMNMINSYLWTIAVINAIVCCVACPLLAQRKGGDIGWAFLGGLLIGPLCLLYYIGLPDLIARKALLEIRDLLKTSNLESRYLARGLKRFFVREEIKKNSGRDIKDKSSSTATGGNC